MAKALLVKRLIENADGSKEIAYSFGDDVPPVGETGAMTFGSDEELRAFINQLEESMDEYRMLAMHLAITYMDKIGTFKATNQVIGKTLTFDVVANSPVKVG